MTNQISKLAAQAWKEVYDETSIDGNDDPAPSIDEVVMFEKKFAELIVKECIGCCEQVISDPVPESVDTWLNGGSQCMAEIKQHFGVEE